MPTGTTAALRAAVILLSQRVKTIAGWRRLVVEATASLPGRSGYTHVVDGETVRVLLSAVVAEGLRHGDPVARHVALHELGHVIIDGGRPTDADGEAGADAFGRAVSGLVCRGC